MMDADGHPMQRFARWHWLAFIAILLVSAWFQFTTVRETRFYNLGGPDAASYVSYAKNLHDYGIYSRREPSESSTAGKPTPDAVSPPGYPLFLTPFLQGEPSWFDFMQRVILAQAALGVLTTLFALLLAARIAGPGVACATGLLTAITPHLATISTNLLTESLFTCLLLASTYAFIRALQGRKRLPWAVAGLIFGACCLVRPTLQLLPFLALALVALLHKGHPWLKETAIAVACCALLLLPWLAWQHSLQQHAGQPNLLRATLYHGSFPDMMYADDPRTRGFAYRFDPQASEIMASYDGLARIVGGRMHAQPLRYLEWYLIGKPRYFLSWDNRSPGAGDAFIEPVADSPFFHRTSFRLMHAFMFGLHWPLILLGVACALLALLRPRFFAPKVHVRSLQLMSWLAIAAIVFHMVGAPYPRYGIPFWPLFYLLAAVLAQAAWGRIRTQGQS